MIYTSVFSALFYAARRGITFIIIMCALFLCGCGNEYHELHEGNADPGEVMIGQIRGCSRLYVAEWGVRKIVAHDDGLRIDGSVMRQDFSIDVPLGKRKVAVPVEATVKAYVDLEGFSKDNVVKRGNEIELILPDPVVVMTGSRIAHDEVRRHVGLLRRDFSDEELTLLEQQGRQAIVEDIPRMDVLETARANAARVIVPIVRQMGYEEKDITVSFRRDLSVKDLIENLSPTPTQKGEKDASPAPPYKEGSRKSF